MPWRRERSGAQRWWSLVLLLTVAATGTGLPIVPFVKKDLSSPFPCQSHACGCANAEMCWNRCGCFSDEERYAWAQRNGVRPPESFQRRLAAVRKAGGSLAANRSGSGRASAGRASSKCGGCCGACETPVRACHSDGSKVVVRTARDRSSSTVLVLSIEEARCKNLAMQILASASGFVPEPVWRPQASPLVERVAEFSAVVIQPDRDPPVPPPRLLDDAAV